MEDVVRRHFELNETAVTILAEERYIAVAERSVFETREEIERFVAADPLFRDTLEPYQEPASAHPIIKRMCDAARLADVGPMAAVAGVIADEAVDAMVSAGSKHCVVDNGGDIAMLLSESVDVGIFTLNPKFQGLGLRFGPSKDRCSVCTSSSTVGPSISLGVAEAATVFSPDAAVADACATRLGNLVKSDEEEVIKGALEDVTWIPGVDGALVIVGDKMAVKGKVPKIVKVRLDPDAISRRQLVQ
ncbi:MAG: UPF0280 family protein [Methanomassiliicoccales archaeon]|nr:UPF0280 family protein [Methanomassiliicoccales archaeon]